MSVIVDLNALFTPRRQKLHITYTANTLRKLTIILR